MFCPTMAINVAEFASWNVTESVSPDADEQFSSMLTQPIDCVQVGETRYQFVRPVQLSWLPTARGWTCHIIGLIGYVGQGDTPEQAFDELKLRIHTDFQILLRKRPFEMDEVQRLNWIQLTSVIDLLYYRTTTPITTREIGQVSFGRISRPYRIKWISSQNYLIDVEKVPGELMSCAPGQWVEADITRDPVNHRILAIESIRKISYRLPSGVELRSIWENMPKAEVEAAAWAW
jgi:hypothetical protein